MDKESDEISKYSSDTHSDYFIRFHLVNEWIRLFRDSSYREYD